MNRLRELRESQNLSLRSLGKLVNMSASVLGNYEREDRHPKKETWEILANHFGVSVPYIMGLTDDPSARLNDNSVENEVSIEVTLLTKADQDNLSHAGKNAIVELTELIDATIKRNDIESLRVFCKFLEFFKSVYYDENSEIFYDEHSLLTTTRSVENFIKQSNYYNEHLLEIFLKRLNGLHNK